MTIATQSGDTRAWSWPEFLGLLLLELWAAHALVFFAHEYAHSTVAWLLHWKANPFALNYAHPTVKVLLLQLGIDQNVNELPIFASNHGTQAAIISGAGAILGNAFITLPLSRWLYHRARASGSRSLGMFAYWMTVASVGNLIDYVPVRTFTDGTDLYQDMFAVEKGLGWSPWTLLVVLGIPTAIVLGDFLFRIEPQTIRWLAPVSTARRVLLALLTAFILFDFYGAAGWSDGGPVSHRMSVVSAVVLAPIMAVVGVWVVTRKARTDRRVQGSVAA